MRFLFPCRHGLKTWGGSSASNSLLSTRHGLAARRVCLIRYSKPQFSCRTFASITPPALVEDEVEVPVGGTGSVRLTVLRPATDSAKANPNVILYLPRGPIFEDESVAGIRDSRTADYLTTHDDSIITEPSSPFGGVLSTPQEVMAAVTEAYIVTLNYRLGYMDRRAATADLDDKIRSRVLYRYPTPVHDTLAGFDWILQTLRPEKLFVFGSNIGGSLATMLALTESEHIHAVGTHEPVCDWTGLDDYCTIDPQSLPGTATIIPAKQDVEGIESQDVHAQPVQTKQNSRHKKKLAPFDLVPLLKTREYLFGIPSRYFDAFASPTLFLRSAGKDVPKTIPKYLTGPEYPTPVLKNPVADDIDLWDIHMQPEDKIASTNSSGQTEERPSRRRKALSRWPPYGLDYGNPSGRGFSKATRLQITLPYVKFFARLSFGEDVSVPSNQWLNDTVSEQEPGSNLEGSEIPRTKNRSNSRKSVTENNSVLGMQAKDMVSVMRRACFWGEEAGKGEERVTLRSLPQTATTSHDAAGQQQQQQLTDPNYLETAHETAHWFRYLTHSSR